MNFKVLFAFLIVIGVSTGEKCFEANSVFYQLPDALCCAQVVYDGDDDILIIGGMQYASELDSVVRYRLSSLLPPTVVGRFEFLSSLGNSKGTAQLTKDGDIYHFGCQSTASDNTTINKLTFLNPNPSEIAIFPNRNYYLISAYDPTQDVIYILGGHNWFDGIYSDSNEILEYEVKTGSVKNVGHLPYLTSGTMSVWVNGAVYIFGGSNWESEEARTRDIRKFTPATGKSEILPQKLSSGIGGGVAVAVGDDIYIVGGAPWIDEPDHYLTKFNTITGEINHYEVDVGGNARDGLGAVYVEKTHRIYLFGGSLITRPEYSARIRYIQLSHDDNCTYP